MAHPAQQFLATENEKLKYFCQVRGIDTSPLPGKTYSASPSSQRTRRYFIEKYPIFLGKADDPDLRSPSFCYVDDVVDGLKMPMGGRANQPTCGMVGAVF